MWLLCSPHYRPPPDILGGELEQQEQEYQSVKPTHAGVPGKGVRRTPHMPATITSSGNLVHFKKSRKPKKAGDATNCLSCPAEPECTSSTPYDLNILFWR